jgi:hypothetical protein
VDGDVRRQAQALQARLSAARPFLDGPPTADPAPPSRPFGSVGGYLEFEERAKRRRVERRLDAARAAIQKRRLKEAAVALREVIELDPHDPELRALIAAFDDLGGSTASAHRGPWMAAAAIFAVMMLSAAWVDDRSSLHSRPTIAVDLAFRHFPPPLLTTTTMDDKGHTVGTSGRLQVLSVAPKPFTKVAPTAELAPSIATASPTAESAALNPETLVDASATASPTSAESATIVPTGGREPFLLHGPPSPVDDELPVQQTLRRYRVAYDGLDARSAQAVWPSVNQTALARAFDGLASQKLTFENCDVQLHGEAATATCRGNTRYVPKIGSREPKIEPRVWNFTLSKAGSDWKIDSARVDR